MELTAVKEMLEQTGLPVTYRAWPEREAPPLPYICYLVGGSDNFFADGKVYEKILRIQIELYTEFKSPETEELVDNALSDMPWQKTETYLDEEACYQILYEIEV